MVPGSTEYGHFTDPRRPMATVDSNKSFRSTDFEAEVAERADFFSNAGDAFLLSDCRSCAAIANTFGHSGKGYTIIIE